MDHHNTTEISPRVAAALDRMEDIMTAKADAGSTDPKSAANMNRPDCKPSPNNSRSPDSSD